MSQQLGRAEVGVSGATDSASEPRRRQPFPMWLLIGFILLQSAWVFTVPPFRGSDEFDHSYRAAAVARGQWIAAPEAATRGTGAFVDVPPDIIAAAAAECWKLPYTGPEDCSGLGATSGGLERVASGAGR